MRKRFAILVGLIAVLVLTLSVGALAAGPGRFNIALLGDGSQQGNVEITGACQAGAPLSVDLQADFGPDEFVIGHVVLSGINAACTNGFVVVNDDAGNLVSFTVTAGEADVEFTVPYALGTIGSIDVLLQE